MVYLASNMAGSRHSSHVIKKRFLSTLHLCASCCLHPWVGGEVHPHGDDESAPKQLQAHSPLALKCNTDCLFLSGPNQHPRLTPIDPFWVTCMCHHCLLHSSGKESTCNAGDIRDTGLISGLGRFPWRRKWQPTLEFLPGKSCGQRSLLGYSPWGHKELDMTEAT